MNIIFALMGLTLVYITQGQDCTANGRFPYYENNCLSFYYCVSYNGTSFLKNNYTCPIGRPFNPISQMCDSTYICSTSTTESSTSSTTTTPISATSSTSVGLQILQVLSQIIDIIFQILGLV